MYLKFLILSVILKYGGYCLEPSEHFPNRIELESNYVLHWKIDSANITFEIHFEKKWALFGIANNQLYYADLIMTWINSDLTGRFHQSYTNKSHLRLSDDLKKDWIPLLATKVPVKLTCDNNKYKLCLNLSLIL
jgi:hypothetical protein